MTRPPGTQRFHGVLPPMITPFKENGEVDYDAFISNIQRWNRDALTGYVVLGSNSETVFLSTDEKLKLIELTVQHAEKGRTILAGTGLESTKGTIWLTNKAAQFGAHAALVLAPHYYGDAMTDEALIQFFTEVADQSDIPILLYNVPKYMHYSLSVEAVKKLSTHPSIIGMKDSSGNVDQLRHYHDVVPENFNLMVGTVAIWTEALELGVQAGVHAAANCIPNLSAKIQEHHEARNNVKAKELQDRIFPLNKAVTATYGIPGLKYAASLLGYNGGYPRKPLLPLNEQGKNDIKNMLREAGIIKED